jgi:type I restriction enzyme M protein
MVEQDTRYIIDSNLTNKGWILDIYNPQKNVFFENDILRIIDNQKLKKLKKRPDYVLFDVKNKKPIGVIEAKAGGKNLDKALDQAMEYADILEAPLIFAMNNSYCRTRHLYKNKPLFIDDKEVNELIRQKEALKFIESNLNEIDITPKQVRLSRQELVNIFKTLNITLRADGFRAGIERLNEFANVLFLKLYCEKKEDNIWNNLISTSNDFLITAFNESLRLIEGKYQATVFTKIQIQKPETLKEIINKLSSLTFANIDIDVIGGTFEYFLQNATATDNDLGEYFTPRHITKAIINLVNPKFKETIYDPFCGTGGFLTEAFNHVKENHIISNKEDVKVLKQETIFGREITSNARLGKMNMILHGDGHSGVEKIDSLGNPVHHEYDIVTTNIPFSQQTKYSHLYYNSLSDGSNNADGVCFLHCFQSVKKGGRLAIIVLDGFLSKPELKCVREFAINNAKLQTIISLPAKAFEPYTSTKTSILYFTDCHISKTIDKVWYYEVKNDGFSLDKYRKVIKKNDLKKVEYVNFAKKIDDDCMFDLGFVPINLDTIKNNNYNLLCKKYESYDISHIFNKNYKKVKFSEILLDTKIEKVVIESNKQYQVLGVRSYGKGVFISKVAEGKQLITKTIKSYQKVNKDCLFWCKVDTKGGSFGVTTSDHENCVASNNRCIYKINTKIINPQFLQLVFKNEKFYNFLDNFVSGSTNRRYIKHHELLNVIISIPNIEEQNILIENINKNKILLEDINCNITSSINSLWQSEEENEPVADKEI